MTAGEIQLNFAQETQLTSDSDAAREGFGDARHLIFGHLVKLAAPHLERYHSDLYHDVYWLDANLEGNRFEFWYGADADGTHVGTDSTLVNYRTHAWHVVVETRPFRDRFKTYITTSEVIRPDGWRK